MIITLLYKDGSRRDIDAYEALRGYISYRLPGGERPIGVDWGQYKDITPEQNRDLYSLVYSRLPMMMGKGVSTKDVVPNPAWYTWLKDKRC